MKILVSGFEPFGGHQTNPTEQLVRTVMMAPSDFISVPHVVKGIVLPVKFSSAYCHLETEILNFEPDVVVSLGLAAGRSKLNLVEIERIAINCIDTDIEDNSGIKPNHQKISECGPDALFSTIPIYKILKNLNDAGVGAQISNSAGTYVCNFLMYRLLDYSRFTKIRAGFVHYPALRKSVEDQSEAINPMTFDKMERSLKLIFNSLVERS